MLKPTKNNLIVTEELEQLSSTLVIPDTAKQRSQLCSVLAVGPKVKDLAAGDRVLAAIYGGTHIEHQGKTLRLLDEGSVLAKVE